MRRHSTDLVGLLFGVTFAFAGVGFLVREATDTSVDWAWVIGLGLMLLGAIALIATLARGPRHDHDHDAQLRVLRAPAVRRAHPAPGDGSRTCGAAEAQVTETQVSETETQPAATTEAEEPTSED